MELVHDLNNALAVLEILLSPDDPDCAGARHAAYEVLSNTKRLVKQLRSPQPAAGPAELQTEFLEFIESRRVILRKLVGDRMRLTFAFDRSLPTLRVDPVALERILFNLVENAVSAIGPKAGVISISVTLAVVDNSAPHENQWFPPVPSGEYVTLAVSDSGPGIDPVKMRQIFMRGVSTRGDGRGLGLSSACDAARQCGGVLQARSIPGKGSSFRVLLPRSGMPVVQAPVG